MRIILILLLSFQLFSQEIKNSASSGGTGGGGGSSPATNLPLKGTGTINGITAAMPGVDFQTPLTYTLNNFVDLATALATISTNNATLVVTAPFVVSINSTVPSNVNMWFLSGSPINCSGTPTIVINGPMVAGNYRTFGSGCIIDLSNNSNFNETHGEWWGVKADNSFDNCTTLTNAWTDSFKTGGGINHNKELYISGGNIRTSCPLLIFTGNIALGAKIIGVYQSTQIIYTGGSTRATIWMAYDGSASGTAIPANSIYGVELKNIAINGGGTATYDVEFDNPVSSNFLDHVYMWNTAASGNSACAYINNATHSGSDYAYCGASSYVNGSGVPQFGYVFNSGDTIRMGNTWVQGVSIASIYFQTASNFPIGGGVTFDSPHLTNSGKTYITDPTGWGNLTFHGGNLGEQDTNTTEDITSYADRVIFESVTFQSNYPIRFRGGTGILLNSCNIQSVTVDAAVHQFMRLNSSVGNTIINHSIDTTVINDFMANGIEPAWNKAANQKRIAIGVGFGTSSPYNPTMWDGGSWFVSNSAAVNISDDAEFTPGSHWRAVFTGNFLTDNAFPNIDSNTPPGVFVKTDVVNTFTFSDAVVWTFSIDGTSGKFKITSSSATLHGFAGTIQFYPSTNAAVGP